MEAKVSFMKFLQYSQYILNKMAFDERLFRKEYRKLIQNLSMVETHQLNTWVRTHHKKIPLYPSGDVG
ncbi:MAG TPA: hypothetical protein DCE41_34245 [Cytophagales bacterium]|nr:hypothetical protein [Cytophagales bacterium]